MVGDLILVRNKGWLFKRIRSILDDALYDHIAVFVTDELILEATPTKGVRIVDATKYLGHSVKVVRLKNQTLVSKFVLACLIRAGESYDFLKLIGLYLRLGLDFGGFTKSLDIKSAFTCSELISTAGIQAGVRFKDGNFVTPEDIGNSSEVEVIFEGETKPCMS